MKKTIFILALIILFLCNIVPKDVVIPNKSIRFRVIANSNNIKDQATKKIIVHNLEKNIETIETNPKNINQARENIINNIPNFTNTVEKTLHNLNLNTNYKINYGMNYFPEKKYKNVIYKEGNYESLVITLGEGKGENFWCVLFPPLCLLDEETIDKDEIEYTSMIKEILKKYF